MRTDEAVRAFLFTDVEGSTKRWEQQPDYMRDALAAHDEILRQAIHAHDGLIFSTAGDGVGAAFTTPDAAVQAAAEAQRRLAEHVWPADLPLKVRMGVHTGPAQLRDDDYFGPTVNRAARLMAAAHGGQTLISGITRKLVGSVSVIDMGEHRLKDLSEPERVWQLLVDDGETEFPSLRTLDAVPTNLPVALSSFVARDDDIRGLLGDLADNRLVTLTGVGGVGKTRLSLQAAASASHHYPQGLWFIELAPVRMLESVPFRLLETLGLEAEPGRQPLETVADWIGNGHMLFIVDNCEHVLEIAASMIAELLVSCPNLRVLASSRRALGVAGEKLRPIQPLDYANAGSAAVELFLERAASAGAPDLSERTDVVRHICARLDGVPLAIELAAARTRSMTPADLAKRLDERFRILTRSPSVEYDERRRTLLSTIEWSYDLLDDNQRLLLQRLSVFAGSFTLQAAEQICSDDLLDEFEIVDLLADLVDHSLLVPNMSGETARYRLLETIREFGLRELGDDYPTLQERHAAFHQRWVHELGLATRTRQEMHALAELEAGWSDLRAAAHHAIGNPALLAQLVEPLAMDAVLRSRLEPGEWARTCLAQTSHDAIERDALTVLLGSAGLSHGTAYEVDEAQQFAMQLARHCENNAIGIVPTVGVPFVAALCGVGRFALAEQMQSLTEAGLDDTAGPWAPPLVASTRALVANFTGDFDAASEAATRSIALVPPDLSLTLDAFVGWVGVLNSRASINERIERMEEVVEQAQSLRSTYALAAFAQTLASLRSGRGDLEQALVETANNLDRVRRTQALGFVNVALRSSAALLVDAGDYSVAAQLLGWVDQQGTSAGGVRYDRRVDNARVTVADMLGDAVAEEASVGRAMSTEAVIELAVSSLRAKAEQLAE